MEKITLLGLILLVFLAASALFFYGGFDNQQDFDDQQEMINKQEFSNLTVLGGGLTGASSDFNLIGADGVKEDGTLKMIVSPVNVISPIADFTQTVTIENKDVDRNIWIAVSSYVDLKVQEFKEWEEPVFDWVEQEFKCKGEWKQILDELSVAQNPHKGWCEDTCTEPGIGLEPFDCNTFEQSFKEYDNKTGIAKYDITQLTAGNEWTEHKESFSKRNVGDVNFYSGQKVFESDNTFLLESGETKKLELNYKPAQAKGKFSVIAWSGAKDCIDWGTCDYIMDFDPTWVQGGWTYRKKIEIESDYIDADLTDYPAYIKFDDDADLVAHALADGNDLRFTSSDMLTLLSFEKENYAVSGADLNGDFWVNIPLLDADANTVIYVYYGNAGVGASDGQDVENVWDENFVSVWHLSDNAANTTVADAHGTNTGTLNGGHNTEDISATGKVAAALDFNGTGDYVNVPADTAITPDANQDFAWSCWVNLATQDRQENFMRESWSGSVIFLGKTNYGSGYWYWYLNFGGTVVQDYSAAATAGEWVHLVFNVDRDNNATLYVNGAVASSKDVSAKEAYAFANTAFTIGGYTSWFTDGLIDEVRISKTARSQVWSTTDYNFMTTPNKMYVKGPEQAANVAPDVNITALDGFSDTLPLMFSDSADGNITTRFWVYDSDGDDLNFNLWSGVTQSAKTTFHYGDVNLSGTYCDSDINGVLGTFCEFDVNTFDIGADGNYFITIEVNDGTDTDTNSTEFVDGFEIDNIPPVIPVTGEEPPQRFFASDDPRVLDTNRFFAPTESRISDTTRFFSPTDPRAQKLKFDTVENSFIIQDITAGDETKLLNVSMGVIILTIIGMAIFLKVRKR